MAKKKDTNKSLVKVKITDLKPNPKNEKVHTNDNLALIKTSLETVGYVNPIIVDENMEILAGHGRYTVMKEMPEFQEIEVVQLTGLSKTTKDKFRLFDNQSGRTGHFNNELLIGTVEDILKDDKDFNISVLGIEGLVDAFSKTVFDFDLGKAPMEKVSAKQRVLVVVDADIEPAMEVLNQNGFNFVLGYATK